MQIAVCGAGAFGQWVGNQILQNAGHHELIGYIDNYKCGDSIGSVYAFDVQLFAEEWMEKTDTVIVAATDWCVRQEMVLSLMKKSFYNIMIADNNVLFGHLPVVKENGELHSYIRPFKADKPILPYVEFHVTDYCNLKCENCGHHSDEIKELSFASEEDFREAIKGLSNRFSNIDTFRLMGGEPLLAPNLEEYIDVILEQFPLCNIKIVTNGMLILKMKEDLKRILRRYAKNIEVQVSQYPNVSHTVAEILEHCHDDQIRISISPPITTFTERGRESIFRGDSGNMQTRWENCKYKYCHFLRDNKLYYCTRCWVEEEFYKNDMHDAVVDIVGGMETGWDILYWIGKPSFACGYCQLFRGKTDWRAKSAK